MVALADNRNTPERDGDLLKEPATNQLIYNGSLVTRNATGHIAKGATSTTLIGVGRAEERVDNSAGAAGAVMISYRKGTFRFENSAAGDLITIADIGKVCWIVDDQTVARTSNTNTRSRAGVVRNVDAQGVWVEFDEALARVGTVTAA